MISVVSRITWLRAQEFEPKHGRGIYFFSESSRPWFRPNLISILWVTGMFKGVTWPRREADLSPLTSAEVKNEWKFTFTPSIRLQGLYRNYFIFYSFCYYVAGSANNISFSWLQGCHLCLWVTSQHVVYMVDGFFAWTIGWVSLRLSFFRVAMRKTEFRVWAIWELVLPWLRQSLVCDCVTYLLLWLPVSKLRALARACYLKYILREMEWEYVDSVQMAKNGVQ